jgi:hypothetical protein
VPLQGTESILAPNPGHRFALLWAVFLQPFRLLKFLDAPIWLCAFQNFWTKTRFRPRFAQIMNGVGFTADGAKRLLKAIEVEVRRDNEKELASAPNSLAKQTIKEKIKKEVKRRMESVASPRSLYSSARPSGWLK